MQKLKLTCSLLILSHLMFFSTLLAIIPTEQLIIKGERQDSNFFHLNSSALKWNPETLRDYSQGHPYNELDLQKIKKETLQNGFESQLGVIQLYLAKQKVLSMVGKTLPRLSVKLGLGSVNLSGTATSFLGFIVPQNWFNLLSSEAGLKSEQLAFHVMLLNQIQQAELTYYNIHRSQIDFEIIRFFMTRIKGILRYVTQKEQLHRNGDINDLEIKLLRGLLNTLELDGLDLKNNIYKSLPHLGYLVNSPHRDDFLDILPLDLKQLPSKKYLKLSDLEKKVMNRSLDLQMLKMKQEEATYDWWSRRSSFFSIDDEVKLDWGVDNIAQVSSSWASIKEAEIKYLEMRSKLLLSLKEIVEDNNHAIDKFYSADLAKRESEADIKKHLDNYFSGKSNSIDGLVYYIEYGLRFELERNAAYHQFLIIQSQIQRLMQSSLPWAIEIIDNLREDEEEMNDHWCC